MNIKRFAEALTTNALDLHMSTQRNCVAAGLMLASAMMLVATAASIIELYGLEDLMYTPRRMVYLLVFLQALTLVSVFCFDRALWRAQPAMLRYAWLAWYGFWMMIVGVALLFMGIDAFTISISIQATLLFAAGLSFYIVTERRK